MFSMNRRWFVANHFGLLKDRGHRKGQKRLWPLAAGQNGQKLAGCIGCTGPLLSAVRARSSARTLCCTVHTVCSVHTVAT